MKKLATAGNRSREAPALLTIRAPAAKILSRETAGGVDADATKEHLYDQAQELDISGRSKMDKGEHVEALEKESKRRTSKNS